MTHEIAAAWIIGGFIMVLAPGAKWPQWISGICIIAIVSLGVASGQ